MDTHLTYSQNKTKNNWSDVVHASLISDASPRARTERYALVVSRGPVSESSPSRVYPTLSRTTRPGERAICSESPVSLLVQPGLVQTSRLSISVLESASSGRTTRGKGGKRAIRSEAPPSSTRCRESRERAIRPSPNLNHSENRNDHGSEKLGLRKGLAQNLAGEILERKCATERLTDLHIPTDKKHLERTIMDASIPEDEMAKRERQHPKRTL